jgi:hypothetical protein
VSTARTQETDLISHIAEPCFRALPEHLRARAFGVDYARFDEKDGGILYVTECGWALREHLIPDHWFREGGYAESGEMLEGATGAVHRVSSPDFAGRRADLVVKVSRFAQHVPIQASPAFPFQIQADAEPGARFNSPFEEFGHLQALRQAPAGPRILTKRALAIYSPPGIFPLWRLGREEWRLRPYQAALEADQRASGGPARVELHSGRKYLTVFGWVKGLTAEQLFLADVLTADDLYDLTVLVARELAEKGFRVLDNKPKHFVLRPDPRTGKPLQRHGRTVYALIDFELLQPLRRG